jgi:hypothetical protein
MRHIDLQKASGSPAASEVTMATDNEIPWIEWAGGKSPVAPSTIVDVRFANGIEMCGYPASDWSEGDTDWWQHKGHSDAHMSIVAYRAQAQEESISDAQINDAIRHGFGDRFANAEQCDRVVAALENLRANPSVDEIPLVLSEIIAIFQPQIAQVSA